MTMNEADARDLITEAGGWAMLGMHAEALLILSALPPESLLESPARAVVLRVCAGMGIWEEGELIAGAFTPEHPQDQRETAGRFLLARAVFLLAEGNATLARERIARLSRLWPEGRSEVIRSPELEGLF